MHQEPDWLKESPPRRLLVVDADEEVHRFVARVLGPTGLDVLAAPDLGSAMAALAQTRVELILVEVEGDRSDFLQRAATLREAEPFVPIIAAARSSGDLAAELVRLGAFDFLAKPIDAGRLERVVAEGLRLGRERRVNLRLLRAVEESRERGVPFGVSPAFRRLLAELEDVPADAGAACIVGEAGSGREAVAQGLHRLRETGGECRVFAARSRCRREDLPFLIRRGLGGTVVIHEAELLNRRLQGTIAAWAGWKESAGEDEPFLVLTLTEGALDQGRSPKNWHPDFRALVDRAPSFTVPPLRERKEDLAFLATMCLDTIVGDLAHQGFTVEALMLLEVLPWPGNLPELAKVVAKAWTLAEGEAIGRRHLCGADDELLRAFLPGRPDEGRLLRRLGGGRSAEDEILPFEEEERRILAKALEATDGNVSRAAALLRIGRATLYRKIHQYGLMALRGRRQAPSTGG